MRNILFTLLISIGTLAGYAQANSEVAKKIENFTRIKDWKTAEKLIQNFKQSLPDTLNELQIVAQYEVSLLEPIVRSAIAREKNLFESLMNASSISLCDSYLQEYPYSEKTREVHWRKAIIRNSWSGYLDFLNIYKQGEYVEMATSNAYALDKAAFDLAKEGNTIENYEKYLIDFPGGNYMELAVELIKNLEYAKRKLAAEKEEEDLFNTGINAFKRKEWITSINHFDNYLNRYPNGKFISEVVSKKQLAQLRQKLSGKSVTYLTFETDRISTIGFSFGGFNVNKATDMYIKFKSNKELYSRGGLFYTIANDGSTSTVDDVGLTGDAQFNTWTALFGLNIKIASPVWAYLGAGVINDGVYYEGELYNWSSGAYKRNVWLKNTDQQTYKFAGEGGLALKIFDVGVLRFGVSYAPQNIVTQLGIGFCW